MEPAPPTNTDIEPPALGEGGSTAASFSDPASASPGAQRPRRRWRRRLLIAGFLLTLVVLFHASLLRLVANGLIVDQPVVHSDAVVFMGAYGPFDQLPLDEVADFYCDGYAPKIVLIEDRSSRVVRMGIAPTLESVIRPELARRRIPDQVLLTLVVDAPGDWARARCLRMWLQENPASQVTVLCDAFASRRQAAIFQQVSTGAETARVRWRALVDRRYDSAKWWCGRQGIVRVAGEYVSLGFVWLNGEEYLPEPWNPDEYEQTLR